MTDCHDTSEHKNNWHDAIWDICDDPDRRPAPSVTPIQLSILYYTGYCLHYTDCSYDHNNRWKDARTPRDPTHDAHSPFLLLSGSRQGPMVHKLHSQFEVAWGANPWNPLLIGNDILQTVSTDCLCLLQSFIQAYGKGTIIFIEPWPMLILGRSGLPVPISQVALIGRGASFLWWMPLRLLFGNQIGSAAARLSRVPLSQQWCNTLTGQSNQHQRPYSFIHILDHVIKWPSHFCKGKSILCDEFEKTPLYKQWKSNQLAQGLCSSQRYTHFVLLQQEIWNIFTMI